MIRLGDKLGNGRASRIARHRKDDDLMEKIIRHRWQALVFMTEFVCMTFELAGMRIMSPDFGTTLDVTTAAIGTILASAALGNWLAGKVRAQDATKVLSISLFLASIWLACAPALYENLVGTNVMGMLPHLAATMLTCIVTFAVPGTCIGAVGPLAIEAHARELGLEPQQASSTLYSAMTLGGLAGTFAGGFILVPTFGAIHLMLISAGVLVVPAALVGMRSADLRGRKTLVATGVSVAVTLAMALAAADTGTKATQDGLDLWLDTQYGRVHVHDTSYNGKGIRALDVSGGFESAMATDDPTELVFDYTKAASNIAKTRTRPDSKVLFLGGGAYSMPKWFAKNQDADVTVVEIDPGVTDVAKKYFQLDEVSGQSRHPIGQITGDARVVCGELTDTYDVIMNDTFAGDEPVRATATIEAAETAKARLNEDGLYVMNIIGILDDAENEFLGWEVMTLREVFDNVHVYSVMPNGTSPLDRPQNWIVVATQDDSWQAPKEYTEVDVSTEGSRVLTDDNSPVEWLSAQLNEKSNP